MNSKEFRDSFSIDKAKIKAKKNHEIVFFAEFDKAGKVISNGFVSSCGCVSYNATMNKDIDMCRMHMKRYMVSDRFVAARKLQEEAFNELIIELDSKDEKTETNNLSTFKKIYIVTTTTISIAYAIHLCVFYLR